MKHTNFAKKSLSAVLVLAMLLGILAMLPITVGAATPSGAGTKENPIQVSTAAQLKALPTTLATAQKTNGVSYVEITADITIGDYNMATIDIDEYPVFIEGNNHKISNFTITSGSTYAGLFHKFAMNSTVQNLHIVNGKVSCASGNDGILAGAAASGFTMINCSTDTQSSAVTGSSGHVGGLVGAFSTGTTGQADYFVDKCVNRATVSNKGQAGGIVGNVWANYAHIVIEDCENYGAVTGTNAAAGIVGRVERALSITVKECVNEAAISATTAAGGIFGKIENAVDDDYVFAYNLNKGAVSATTYAGGILAYSDGKTLFNITNCGNEGTITTTASAGVTAGILAYANVTIDAGTRHWFAGCYNIGKLAAAGAATSGGIIGKFIADEQKQNGLTISTSYDNAARTLSGTAGSNHGLLAGSITGCDDMESLDNNDVNNYLYFYNSIALKQTNVTTLGGSSSVDDEQTSSVETSATTALTNGIKSCQENVLIRKPDGLGTEDAPYVIDEKNEMLWFINNYSRLDNMTYIDLMCDVDLDGRRVSLDMSEGQYYEPRSLYLDAHGHTLSNYTTNRGFFSRLGPKSTIKNLKLTGVTASGNTGDNYIVGALGGQVYYGLTMINVSIANSTVTQPKNNVAGGIIGSIETDGGVDSFIMGCSSSATVTGTGIAGGILGKAWSRYADITIMGCTNTGTITTDGTGSTNSIGGIMGWADTMSYLSIYNCTNTGAIGSSSVAACAGGILGDISTNVAYATTVKSCRNEGAVSSSTYAGGIVAYMTNAKGLNMDACANVAKITGATAAGAIFGQTAGNATVTITNSYNTGTAAGGITPATTKVTTTGCYTGSVTAANKAAADARLTLAPSAQNLSVRVKLTDNFGLMAITSVMDGKTVSSYQEVGFYFLESDTMPLPSELIKEENKRVGEAYNESTTRFCAAYTDLLAVNFDRDIHFLAYAIDKSGNTVYSEIRTLKVEPLVAALSEGYNGLVTNPYELALYAEMLNYAEAYEKFEAFDLKIGNLNLAQNSFDKTKPDNGYNYASNTQANANIERYAQTMYDLGLDVFGLNEVDVFTRYHGGNHTPYEIAKLMEEKTGDEYYWAFATALDGSKATYSSGYSVRTFESVYTSTNKPDGMYYSGDGSYNANGTTGYYGEGLVSKYPIVGYEAVPIVLAGNITAPVASDFKTTEEYEAELAKYEAHNALDESVHYVSDSTSPAKGYERRVVLVAQLDVNGEIVTVMVSHFDHTGNKYALEASIKTIKSLLTKYGNTPCFLTGDLNIPRHSTWVKQLDDTLLDRAGMGDMTKTFSGGSKIDHIYYGQYTEILEYQSVTSNYSSDHFPVYAVARIKRADFR